MYGILKKSAGMGVGKDKNYVLSEGLPYAFYF